MARALTAPPTPVRFLPPVDLIRFVRPEFERPSDEHEMRARASRPAELPELARSGGSPRRRRGRRSRRRDNGQSPARPARRASQARRRSSLKRARALRAARPSSTRAPPTIVRRRLDPGTPSAIPITFPAAPITRSHAIGSATPISLQSARSTRLTEFTHPTRAVLAGDLLGLTARHCAFSLRSSLCSARTAAVKELARLPKRSEAAP
jgi:hypothetical protein